MTLLNFVCPAGNGSGSIHLAESGDSYRENEFIWLIIIDRFINFIDIYIYNIMQATFN